MYSGASCDGVPTVSNGRRWYPEQIEDHLHVEKRVAEGALQAAL